MIFPLLAVVMTGEKSGVLEARDGVAIAAS